MLYMARTKVKFTDFGVQDNFFNDDRAIMYAFSLSKQTILDEEKEFGIYNKMVMVEYYEFLGRLAHLLY